MASNQPRISGQAGSAYVAAIPYAQNRFPEPRRLAIPPPNLDYVQGQPVIHRSTFHQPGPREYGTSEYGSPAFIQSVFSCSDTTVSHAMLSWQYEMRRKAQNILPFLLLGPNTAAQDTNFVRNAGITLMISVRSAVAARARPKYLDPSQYASSAGVSTLVLDLDTPYDLIKRLPQTIKAMNDHLEASCTRLPLVSIEDIGGRIMVFCESGNERSTALVAGYIMVVYGVDVVGAIQIIQSQRFCIAPDDPMKNMLMVFDDILKAKHEVAMHRMVGIAPIATKRTIDMAYDSDEEMEEGDDDIPVAEMGKRKDWMPFDDHTG